ncbi:MAG: class I SAM-dependent methyltransferase [Acidimicrobiia bacterium]
MEGPDRRALWNANAPVWTELSRAGFDVYRDLVNTPAFLALLPPVEGLRCLDLGCGEGHNTRLLAARGADVTGLDIAEAFIEAAAREGGPGVRYLVGDGCSLPFPAATFDLVTAFMSLMDAGDPEGILHEVSRVLRPGGTVQFSIGHPTSTTPVRHWVDDGAGRRHALAIGDYFYEGIQTETWIFGAAPPEVRGGHRPFTITYARRTLAGWLNAVAGAGLSIDAVAEPHADEDTATRHPEVADTRIAPYFLIVRARRL